MDTDMDTDTDTDTDDKAIGKQGGNKAIARKRKEQTYLETHTCKNMTHIHEFNLQTYFYTAQYTV